MRSSEKYYFVLLAFLLPGLSLNEASPNDSIPTERNGVIFEKLADNVWMHTSYIDLPEWGLIPSNGLVIVDGEHATLIDTGWNDKQTETILTWAENDLARAINRAVFTHAHADKMGGVGAVRQRGIATYAHPLSNQIALGKELVPAEFNLSFDLAGLANDFGPMSVFYPGPGHTEDNIVVVVESAQIIFGGCLIRPAGAKSLGNTDDAFLQQWAGSVQAIAKTYPDAKVVVPSHGPPAGFELLEQTVNLARKTPGSE